MLKKNQQMNKMSTKKKIIKEVVWECLSCGYKTIGSVKPTKCACSQAKYAINSIYKVGD